MPRRPDWSNDAVDADVRAANLRPVSYEARGLVRSANGHWTFRCLSDGWYVSATVGTAVTVPADVENQPFETLELALGELALALLPDFCP